MPDKNSKKPVKKMNIAIGKKGRFDPSKFINVEPMLKEAKRNTIVISFGRMNPVTVGHEKLVNKVVSEALDRTADVGIYLSHTQDKKKNPLSYEDKVAFASKAFGKAIKKSSAKTIIDVAKELSGKYDTLILVVGSDRVNEFETLLNKYNGKEFNFDNIEVISAGERDPDADDVSGMSASKMRSLAYEGNFADFSKGLPKKLKTSSKEVYNSVRKGLGMNEEFIIEETIEEAALSVQQRRRRGLQMRRLKGRLKVARQKAKRRLASKEKLQIRARRKARTIIRNRLSKKPYSDMSPSEKVALDKRLSRIPQAVIDRIARKQLPTVRKAEVERLHNVLNPAAKNEHFDTFLENYYAGLSKSTSEKRKAHFEKGKRMNDDNPAAYKPAPGDARAKTKPSVHTKRFKQMFGEELDEACERDTMPRKRYHMALEKNGSVKFDKRFKFFKKNLEESNEDLLSEIIGLQEAVEFFLDLEESSNEGLKNKAEKTGISYGILKKVYDRGVAAWRTGHRPGTTPAQWGMARVNSFATKGKGTWGKADSDLAAKVRKEEVELDEGENLARVKLQIAREKNSDKEKHERMKTAAAARDKNVREGVTTVKPFVSFITKSYAPKVPKHVQHALGINVPLKHMVGDAIKAVDIDNDGDVDKFEKSTPDEITGAEKKDMTKVMQKKLSGEVKHTKRGLAFEEVDKADPANREYGTDSLVKILKGDTPGQEVKESALNDFIEKGARVSFVYRTMTDGPKTIKGTVVGTETYSHEGSSDAVSSKGRLRVRDDAGRLYIVKHEDVQLMEDTQTRGFEGKMINVKDVLVRMMDGSMKRLPPGKSSSSDGNGGNGE